MKSCSPLTTELLDRGSPQLELDAARLKVCAGPDKGLGYELSLHPVRIGTEPDCELVLHDATVSGRHAEITAGDRGYVIRDLGSKNGMRIGPWPVERAMLAGGMVIHLGKTALKVVRAGGRHRVPLALPGQLGELVAHSVKMRALAALVEEYASTDITVLIEGETGVGKEVVARTLHELGPRAARPFVVFDGGGVPHTLVGGELFGHLEGAFTGASRARQGAFRAAQGGTLFLDEVGELPLDVQPWLLRALETRLVRPIGADSEIPVDARIVAATNRNLEEEVRAGRFRPDLFFRLAVGRLRVPPLRERPQDIAILAKQFAAEEGVTLPAEMMPLLLTYPWPGNVRELRNAITRAAVLPGELDLAMAADEDEDGAGAQAGIPSLRAARDRARDAFERDYLERLLVSCNHNLSQAARLARVSRSFLMRLASKHKMRLRDRQP